MDKKKLHVDDLENTSGGTSEKSNNKWLVRTKAHLLPDYSYCTIFSNKQEAETCFANIKNPQDYEIVQQ